MGDVSPGGWDRSGGARLAAEPWTRRLADASEDYYHQLWYAHMLSATAKDDIAEKHYRQAIDNYSHAMTIP